MDSSQYPSWWSGAGICAKASWLHLTKRAKSIEEAFGILGRRKKKPAVDSRRVSVEKYQENMRKLNLD